MNKATEIWNRACYDYKLRNSAIGDRALAGMLQLHGRVMNGGMLDAVENFDDSQLESAKSGYQYFGLGPVADLIVQAKVALGKERAAGETVHLLSRGEIDVYAEFVDEDLGELEVSLDREYARLIPDDSALFERFETYLAANPVDFAEVPTSDTDADDS